MKKNEGEEKSAGIQAAGKGGKFGLYGKQRMQIFPLHLKTLCKLSLHLSKNWLQVEQVEKKKKTPLSLNTKGKKRGLWMQME